MNVAGAGLAGITSGAQEEKWESGVACQGIDIIAIWRAIYDSPAAHAWFWHAHVMVEQIGLHEGLAYSGCG